MTSTKSRKFWFVPLILVILVALFFWLKAQPATTKQKTVTIHYSAAASLKESLTTIYQRFEKDHPNIKIDFDFAGSGQIRQKVLNGAPIDGVLLASKADTTQLTDKNLLANSKLLLGNQLVVITNKQNSQFDQQSLTDILKKSQKIAIGQPKTVPAGAYATQTLQHLDLLSTVQPKLVMASDVRQVLYYVASGNAEVGFVYQTDVPIDHSVKALATVPATNHQPIAYYTGTIKAQNHQSATKTFNTYLQSKTANQVFKKAGFTLK